MEYGIVTVSEKKLFARIIQLFTFSKWNHVALYINTGIYKNLIVEMNSKGLNLYRLEEYKKNKDIQIHKNTPKIDIKKSLIFISKNKNKKYDYLKTFLFFYRKKDVQSENKWNCIEFIEKIFMDQGIDLFNGKNLTPGQINKQLSSEEDLTFLDK